MRSLLLGVVVSFVVLPVAGAAAAPLVEVWSGGLAPGSTGAGVLLRADGSGQRLSSDSDGSFHVRGSFAPRGAKLTALQAAAERVLAHAPAVTRDDDILDGTFAMVAVRDGSRFKFVVDSNKDSAPVKALLQRLDAALPHASRLATASRVASAKVAHARARVASIVSPGMSTCRPGQNFVHVEKRVSLEDAVAAGAVTNLRAKGPAGGDSVAMDAHWVDVPAESESITFDAIVESGLPGVSNEQAAQTVQDIARQVPPVDVRGVDVSLKWNIAPAGSPSPPCRMGIYLMGGSGPNHLPTYNAAVPPHMAVGWPGGFDMFADSKSLPGDLMHETGHAALDLPESGTAVIYSARNSGEIPITLTGAHTAQYILEHLNDPATGFSVAFRPNPEDPKDVMGASNEPGARYRTSDLDPFLDKATLVIHGKPGQILVNKNGRNQNLAIGPPTEVRVPYNGSVHVDGVVAYCIDLLGHETPTAGEDSFDVLPTAGQLGGEGMSALQRVMEVVAARAPGPLEETPGANAAIWRVTDNLSVGPDADPAAVSILQAAGVPLSTGDPATDTLFDTPHFSDPAAAIPHPVALASPTAATPVPAPPRSAPIGWKLTRLQLVRRRLPAPHGRTPLLLLAFATLTGHPDRVSLTLTQRRGHRTVTVARSRARSIRQGTTPLQLHVRRLRPGRYVLVVHGKHSGTRHTTVTLARPRTR
jgi:hypothetical protein